MRGESSKKERHLSGANDNIVFHLVREKTSLIVVDMQNDFVRKGAPMEIPDARERVPHVNKLIQGCRDLDVPIVFVRFIAGPERTLIWTWSPMIAPPVKCCWKNHRRYYADIDEEAEAIGIIDEITVNPQDYVVDKYAYGAFYNTRLADILRTHRAEYVIICGAAMPICINDTVSGAFERGLKTVLAADASASFTEEFRYYSLALFEAKYAVVLNVDDILSELKNGRND